MIKGRRRAVRQPTQRVWRRIYLLEWRGKRGLSVEKLGELAGVSPGMISLIENRKSAGSPETLEKLADAMQISVGELFAPPPEPGEIIVSARIREDQRDAFAKLLGIIDGKQLTKS